MLKRKSFVTFIKSLSYMRAFVSLVVSMFQTRGSRDYIANCVTLRFSLGSIVIVFAKIYWVIMLS